MGAFYLRPGRAVSFYLVVPTGVAAPGSSINLQS